MTVQTWSTDMPVEECEELLETATVGRLGVLVEGRPEIYPVNHVFDRALHSVVFPTGDRVALFGAALNWPFVAFEVDGGADDEHGGWSVLVVGHAEEVTAPAVIERCRTHRTVRWGGTASSRWLRIVSSKVTGRHNRAVER